jgi:hypothetical protein
VDADVFVVEAEVEVFDVQAAVSMSAVVGTARPGR